LLDQNLHHSPFYYISFLTLDFTYNRNVYMTGKDGKLLQACFEWSLNEVFIWFGHCLKCNIVRFRWHFSFVKWDKSGFGYTDILWPITFRGRGTFRIWGLNIDFFKTLCAWISPEVFACPWGDLCVRLSFQNITNQLNGI
jgi:hypothetical protein